MDNGLETKVAFGDFMQAFEAFKESNDDRLGQIEQRMSADVVTSDKVDRINRAVDETKARLDELVLKGKRPSLSGSDEMPAAMEHSRAFDSYVRKGETRGLSGIEAKSMSIGSNSDGGYLVPPETETHIGSLLKLVSPIRAVAGVRQMSSSLYKKPFAITGAVTGWVGETAARPETAAPTLAELQFPATELYAMPAATQALLDDAAVNLEGWLAEEVQQAFAEQESAAFVTGNGTNKPKGFLAYSNVADASWSWGSLGYAATGTAGAFPAANPADKLVDLVESAWQHHPQIALMVRQEAVARADADIAQSNKRPDWSVELMYSQRGPAYSNMVSVNVSIPIQLDPRNRQDREVAARLAVVEQMRAQREEATREHVAETLGWLQEWQSDRDRLAHYDSALIPLAGERTRAALAAYRGGAGPLGAVLEARRLEIDTRMDRLRLEMEAAGLWAQLEYLIPPEHEAATPDRSSTVTEQKP